MGYPIISKIQSFIQSKHNDWVNIITALKKFTNTYFVIEYRAKDNFPLVYLEKIYNFEMVSLDSKVLVIRISRIFDDFVVKKDRTEG